MAGLIAPDCVRYSINGAYLGRPHVNVLDMVVLTGGILDRESDVRFVAGQVGKQWVDHVMPNLANDYSLDSISYVDLSVADGFVGSLSNVDGVSLPVTGDLTEEPLTAACAMLITKETAARRGQRPGRWFLGGLTENYINGNIISGGYLSDMNSGLSTFLEDITETSPIAEREYFPTVIHTRTEDAPGGKLVIYEGNTQITDLNCSGRISTQRRRNRR